MVLCAVPATNDMLSTIQMAHVIRPFQSYTLKPSGVQQPEVTLGHRGANEWPPEGQQKKPHPVIRY